MNNVLHNGAIGFYSKTLRKGYKNAKNDFTKKIMNSTNIGISYEK